MGQDIIVSTWAAIGSGAVAGVVALMTMLSPGSLALPYALPACIAVGMAGAALDYIIKGQLVGEGILSIADLFARVAAISTLYTGVGLLAGALLAVAVQKLRGLFRA